MASATACGPGRDVPCSSAAGARDAAVCRPRGRPFGVLRGATEFRRVRREGRRRRVGGVTVITAPAGSASPRVGVSVGRSVGGSVQRNRAKRRLREALALVVLPPGRDYVVLAGREVLETPFQELVAWLGGAVEEEARET